MKSEIKRLDRLEQQFLLPSSENSWFWGYFFICRQKLLSSTILYSHILMDTDCVGGALLFGTQSDVHFHVWPNSVLPLTLQTSLCSGTFFVETFGPKGVHCIVKLIWELHEKNIQNIKHYMENNTFKVSRLAE